MQKLSKRTKCKACGWEFKGNFCPNCGQSAETHRLSFKRIVTESISGLYHMDNRIVRTCVDLLRRPGHMMREYFDGNRVKYYKPVPLLFILVAVYMVIDHYFGIPADIIVKKSTESLDTLAGKNQVIYGMLPVYRR